MISFLVLFMSPILSYKCKKTFLFSNITLLFFDILAVLILSIIWKMSGRHLSKFIDKYGTGFIVFCSMILFLVQVYICYNIYFLSGWDVGYVIAVARASIAERPLNNAYSYFSRYPNNILILWIFTKILKINIDFGILDTANGLMAIITLNCIISTLSSILVYKCTEKLTNKKWAIFAWIVYFLLIGTSPWLVITYSDSLALFLPILIFYIYTRDLKGKYYLLKWFFIGIISFLGYHIKPQVIIIFIAIVIVEILRFIFLTNNMKKKKIFTLVILIFTFFLSSVIFKTICKDTKLIINAERKFGFAHFAMMGLNFKTTGIYNQDDVNFSGKYATLSERNKANITVIKERLNNYGVSGYIKFLVQKTLVNYGDGTFAWSLEGGFYKEKYDDKNAWISPILKSCYYNDGKNYNKTSTFEQAVWIGIILSMLGSIFIHKHSIDNKIAVLMLTVMGLTVFVLLFEARARYLYIYSPIYIVLCTLGLKNMVIKIKTLRQNAYLKYKNKKYK